MCTGNEEVLERVLTAHITSDRYGDECGLTHFVVGCTLARRSTEPGEGMHSRCVKLQSYMRNGDALRELPYTGELISLLEGYKDMTDQNKWYDNGTTPHFLRFTR